MPRRLFTTFNVLGGVIWSTLVILLGFGLAHIPGVADFAAKYIDVVLIGIVILSVVPILIRAIAARRKSISASAN